jgi:hypothetical protein
MLTLEDWLSTVNSLKNKLVKNRLKGEVTFRCLLDQIFKGTDDSLNRIAESRSTEPLARARAEIWLQ